MTKYEIFAKILTAIANSVAPLFAGSLTKYDVAARTALKAAVTKTDNGLDSLLALYRQYESEHPLLQTAIDDACSLLENSGITIIDARTLETALKAAIHDIAAPLLAPAASAPATTQAG